MPFVQKKRPKKQTGVSKLKILDFCLILLQGDKAALCSFASGATEILAAETQILFDDHLILMIMSLLSFY